MASVEPPYHRPSVVFSTRRLALLYSGGARLPALAVIYEQRVQAMKESFPDPSLGQIFSITKKMFLAKNDRYGF